MVLVRPIVDAPEAVDVAAGDGAEAIEIVIGAVAPSWLATAVGRAHQRGLAVVVRIAPQPDRGPEEAAGHEIGAVCAALAAGADHIEGIEPGRVARIRTVLDAIATGEAPR